MTDIELIDESLLPPVARRLVKVIGMAETLVLLQARGGIPTRMPVRAERCAVLEDILSQEALDKLAASDLAGERLELPKADKAQMQLRNLAIAEARNSKSAAAVAREFQLTRRRVIMISNELQDQADDPQGDLFACEPSSDAIS